MSARREQILDVAERVLEEVGLDRFGIGELARALGIRPPSLYKHFASLEEIQHALISRALRRLGDALADATELAGFCRVYRACALGAPQLYRLMTDRPLNRGLLDPGAEPAGMAGILRLFGETESRHPRARAAWAGAHGLVSLEIAGRFPPSADLDQSWAELVAAFAKHPGAPKGA
ncbi:TetR/AcrR family transcriptional regulator [Microbacterium soli]|uniref:TetR/AcrR family transcriptional regulator n=1 Tax=Microbacterium soli TaxID=446075 RepID=UPI0031DA4B84